MRRKINRAVSDNDLQQAKQLKEELSKKLNQIKKVAPKFDLNQKKDNFFIPKFDLGFNLFKN